MNEVFVRRLIGLSVLLSVLFGFTWLLPHGLRNGEDDVPSTTVPLETTSIGVSAIAETPPPVDKPGVEPAPASEQVVEASPPKPSIAPPVAPASATKAQARPKPPAPPKTIKPIETPPKVAIVSTPPRLTPGVVKPVVPKKSNNSVVGAATTPHTTVTPPVVATKPATPGPAVIAQAAPPGPLVPATSTPQARIWFVQIGSYSDHDKAQTTVSLLQNVGYRAEIGPVSGPGGSILQRVRIGPFPSEAVARQAQDKIAHQGYPESRAVSESRGTQ